MHLLTMCAVRFDTSKSHVQSVKGSSNQQSATMSRMNACLRAELTSQHECIQNLIKCMTNAHLDTLPPKPSVGGEQPTMKCTRLARQGLFVCKVEHKGGKGLAVLAQLAFLSLRGV